MSQLTEEAKKIAHVFYNMKNRCYRETNPSYPLYGGSTPAVYVCEEWLKGGAKAFIKWSLDNGYKKGLEIDRYPDKTGPYSPENCRWVSQRVNNMNRATTFHVVYEGHNQPLSLVMEKLYPGYTKDFYLVIAARIRKLGWSVEEALSIPIKKYRKTLTV